MTFAQSSHLLSTHKAQKHASGFTSNWVKTCLLVAQMWRIFLVLSIVSHANEMNNDQHHQIWHAKTLYEGVFFPLSFEHLDRLERRKLTTSLAFYSFLPWALNCSRQMKHLMTAPAPSWGPLPCPLPKKLHVILHPFIMFEYCETKYQGFEYLNWLAHTLNQTYVSFLGQICTSNVTWSNATKI